MENSQVSTTTTSKERLADWIERGLSLGMEETRGIFLGSGGLFFRRATCGCALGISLVGKIGDRRKAFKAYMETSRFNRGLSGAQVFAELLNVPHELTVKISATHFMGEATATEIADMLRTEKI